MKIKNFLILVSFIILITKEFLPLSYEIFVILGAIFIFLFMKKSLTPMLTDFFAVEKQNIEESFKKKIKLSVDKLKLTKKFFPIEEEIRDIILEPENHKNLVQKSQNELNALITSRLNTLVRKIKTYR